MPSINLCVLGFMCDVNIPRSRYVLFNGALASALVLLPYRVLIEFAITTIAMPTLCFLASFLVLRLTEPELQHRFRACPGGDSNFGFFLAVCLVLPPAALTILQVTLSLSDQVSTRATAQATQAPYRTGPTCTTTLLAAYHLVWRATWISTMSSVVACDVWTCFERMLVMTGGGRR